MTEQERNLIRDAMMFAVKDMTGRVMREATVQSMIDDFKKAINVIRCCEVLKDKEVPNFEEWREEFYKHRQDVYIEYGSGEVYSNEEVVKDYNSIFKTNL